MQSDEFSAPSSQRALLPEQTSVLTRRMLSGLQQASLMLVVEAMRLVQLFDGMLSGRSVPSHDCGGHPSGGHATDDIACVLHLVCGAAGSSPPGARRHIQLIQEPLAPPAIQGRSRRPGRASCRGTTLHNVPSYLCCCGSCAVCCVVVTDVPSSKHSVRVPAVHWRAGCVVVAVVRGMSGPGGFGMGVPHCPGRGPCRQRPWRREGERALCARS